MNENKINVGGQAVLEGVMMRSPNSFAVVVRRADGSMVVREEPWRSLSGKYKPLRWPFVRGMIVLFESLFNGISALTFSAEQASLDIDAQENAKKKEEAAAAGKDETDIEPPESKPLPKSAIFLTMLVSLAFAVALFKFLPHLITVGLSKLLDVDIPINGAAFHIIDGALKITIFFAYIWGVSRMNEMRRVFSYHGAEHKSIACYEKGLPLTVENARAQSRFHPRCGTSFIIIVLLVSIMVFALFFRMLPPLSDNKTINVVLQMFVKLPLMLPIAGLAYEFIKLAGRENAPFFARWLSAPGLWSQRLTTAEPDDSMLEVALVSLKISLLREREISGNAQAALPDARHVRTIKSLDEVVTL